MVFTLLEDRITTFFSSDDTAVAIADKSLTLNYIAPSVNTFNVVSRQLSYYVKDDMLGHFNGKVNSQINSNSLQVERQV